MPGTVLTGRPSGCPARRGRASDTGNSVCVPLFNAIDPGSTGSQGPWRHFRSSISTDGCHGLPSRMKTNTLAATDPARWRASEIAKSQSEGAQAWHQYRYTIGHHLRNHSQSPWDEAAANAVEAAAKLPHAADTQLPDTDLNAPFV